MSKKQASIALCLFLPIQLLFLREVLAKYGDLALLGKKEHQCSSNKHDLPTHGIERVYQFFSQILKTITGHARIITPTMNTIKGVAKILPYQPKTFTPGEERRRMKRLQALCS